MISRIFAALLSFDASVVCAQSVSKEMAGEICSTVASNLNGEASSIKEIEFKGDNEKYQPLFKELGWDESLGVGVYAEVELEERQEVFEMINLGGTCPSMNIVRVKRLSDDATTQDEIDAQTTLSDEEHQQLGWNAQSSLFWVGERLVSTLQSSSMVNVYIEDAKGKHKICDLRSNGNRTVIMRSSNNNLCEAARDGTLTPLSGREAALPVTDLEKWGIDTPGHWNNPTAYNVIVQGQSHTVATLSWDSSAGCTRNVVWAMELDNDDHVADTKLTRNLLGVKDDSFDADYWRNVDVGYFQFDSLPVIVQNNMSTINVGVIGENDVKSVCELQEFQRFNVGAINEVDN